MVEGVVDGNSKGKTEGCFEGFEVGIVEGEYVLGLDEGLKEGSQLKNITKTIEFDTDRKNFNMVSETSSKRYLIKFSPTPTAPPKPVAF